GQMDAIWWPACRLNRVACFSYKYRWAGWLRPAHARPVRVAFEPTNAAPRSAARTTCPCLNVPTGCLHDATRLDRCISTASGRPERCSRRDCQSRSSGTEDDRDRTGHVHDLWTRECAAAGGLWTDGRRGADVDRPQPRG